MARHDTLERNSASSRPRRGCRARLRAAGRHRAGRRDRAEIEEPTATRRPRRWYSDEPLGQAFVKPWRDEQQRRDRRRDSTWGQARQGSRAPRGDLRRGARAVHARRGSRPLAEVAAASVGRGEGAKRIGWRRATAKRTSRNADSLTRRWRRSRGDARWCRGSSATGALHARAGEVRDRIAQGSRRAATPWSRSSTRSTRAARVATTLFAELETSATSTLAAPRHRRHHRSAGPEARTRRSSRWAAAPRARPQAVEARARSPGVRRARREARASRHHARDPRASRRSTAYIARNERWKTPRDGEGGRRGASEGTQAHEAWCGAHRLRQRRGAWRPEGADRRDREELATPWKTRERTGEAAPAEAR